MNTTLQLFSALAIALISIFVSSQTSAVMIDLTSPNSHLNDNLISQSGNPPQVTGPGPSEIDFIAAFRNDRPIVLEVLIEQLDDLSVLGMSGVLLNMTSNPWTTLEVRLSEGARFANLMRLGLDADVSLLDDRHRAILELHNAVSPQGSYRFGNPDNEADPLDWMITLDNFSVGDRFTVSFATRAIASGSPVPNRIPEPGSVALLLAALLAVTIKQRTRRLGSVVKH